MPSLIDLTGRRFGRLIVTARAPSKHKRTRWLTRCDCGTEKVIGAQNLTTKVPDRRVVSCGCYRHDVSFRPNAASRNPVFHLLWAAKKRAKSKGIAFDLRAEDIVIPDRCPLLGVPLQRAANFRGSSSPSLDRIRSDHGYVRGNVWVISYRANAIKNDATLAELRMIVDGLERRCGS